MRQVFLTLLFLSTSLKLFSQDVNDIIYDLMRENDDVTTSPCDAKDGLIISNKALNIYFADKVASYLAEDGDLSLFKTYATLNSSDGTVTLNHNFALRTKTNGFLARMTTIGAKVNALDGFASIFSDKSFSNEMGVNFKHTWFGKGTLYFDDCFQRQTRAGVQKGGVHKMVMDRERARILHVLELELHQKAADFERSLDSIAASDVPSQIVDTVRASLRADFYPKLQAEYQKKFSEQQASAVQETGSYHKITTNWTSISAYIPVTVKKYNVTPDYLSNFIEETIYPWELALTHTRIKEGRLGRMFYSISGIVFQNDNISTEVLEKTEIKKYADGPDSSAKAEIQSDEVYIGKYSSFVTPKIKAQFVWFPKDKNVGISAIVEQNFGRYNPVNGRIGLPVRLNDKDGEAAVNFEIQARFSDMTDQINKSDSFWEKTSIGINVGLPFTTIVE